MFSHSRRHRKICGCRLIFSKQGRVEGEGAAAAPPPNGRDRQGGLGEQLPRKLLIMADTRFLLAMFKDPLFIDRRYRHLQSEVVGQQKPQLIQRNTLPQNTNPCKNKPLRNFFNIYAMCSRFSQVFASCFEFGNVLGSTWTCWDAFRYVRMHLDVFGSVWPCLVNFENFCNPLTVFKLFG